LHTYCQIGLSRIVQAVLVVCLFLLESAPTRAEPQVPDQEVLDMGKALFQGGATPACAICHTLADAGTSGTIGPNLDTMALDMEKVMTAINEGTGVMPSFADSLSEQQRMAIAQYVVWATQQK